RFLEDPDQRIVIERIERREHRQTADQLRDQPEAQHVLRLDAAQRADERVLAQVRFAEADPPLAAPLLHDLLETVKRAAADEQDVARVDLDVFLLRMLAAALRRNGSDRALQDLEQCLLHALARHVARDRRVLRLARDLVDLVDVDDAALALRNVEVRSLEQPYQDVLDILTHVTGLGECRRIGDRERDLEHACERLREQRLTDAGRADQQDVRLVDLDIIADAVMIDALVIDVDRDPPGALCLLLTDHVLVQDVLDLARRRYARYRFRSFALLLLREDLIAERYALIADVDRWAGDELLHRLLRFAAETAAQVLLARHRRLPLVLVLLDRVRHHFSAVSHDVVNDSVLHGFRRAHEAVTVDVLRD